MKCKFDDHKELVECVRQSKILGPGPGLIPVVYDSGEIVQIKILYREPDNHNWAISDIVRALMERLLRDYKMDSAILFGFKCKKYHNGKFVKWCLLETDCTERYSVFANRLVRKDFPGTNIFYTFADPHGVMLALSKTLRELNGTLPLGTEVRYEG